MPILAESFGGYNHKNIVEAEGDTWNEILTSINENETPIIKNGKVIYHTNGFPYLRLVA